MQIFALGKQYTYLYVAGSLHVYAEYKNMVRQEQYTYLYKYIWGLQINATKQEHGTMRTIYIHEYLWGLLLNGTQNKNMTPQKQYTYLYMGIYKATRLW